MEKENITLQYIAVWNWHIIALLFLLSGIVLFFSSKSGLAADAFFVVFVLAFGFCELMSYRRRLKFLRYKDE